MISSSRALIGSPFLPFNPFLEFFFPGGALSLTLAEDSGFEVEALDCEPGIYSARYLRPDATYPERFDAILAQQLADAEKRARAHFVVDTSRGLELAREQVAEIIATMRDQQLRPASGRTPS